MLKQPDEEWEEAQERVIPEWGGALEYQHQDVTDTRGLNTTIDRIASENRGLHGVIAAAGI